MDLQRWTCHKKHCPPSHMTWCAWSRTEVYWKLSFLGDYEAGVHLKVASKICPSAVIKVTIGTPNPFNYWTIFCIKATLKHHIKKMSNYREIFALIQMKVSDYRSSSSQNLPEIRQFWTQADIFRFHFICNISRE